MAIRYENEKLFGLPIPEDGVSLGKIAVQGVTALVAQQNVVVSGSYSLPTVTITFKGISTPPIAIPAKDGIGGSFSFRGKQWTVTDVVEGGKYQIAGTVMFSSWTLTAVSFTSGKVVIG